MPSIRRFLLISLLVSVSIVTISTAIWTYNSVTDEIDDLFDGQLVEAAHILRRITTHGGAPKQDSASKSPLFTDNAKFTAVVDESFPFFHHHYALQRSFQIWRADGSLMLKSSSAPDFSLAPNQGGFSTTVLGDSSWRVFSLTDPKSKLQFQVAQLHQVRNKLVRTIAFTEIVPFILMYPLLAIAVWYAVEFALRQIKRVTAEVRERTEPGELKPLCITNVPSEVSPLVEELNNLFQRLEHAFAREKRFAADAAHELRTPLASVKTQAQVALRADNQDTLNKALSQIIAGVNRCTHVVQQLSILNSLKPDEPMYGLVDVELNELARTIITDVYPFALTNKVDIELHPAPEPALLKANEVLLQILLRNLIDNAIRYSGHDALVRVTISRNQADSSKNTADLVIKVEDNGPGIPTELRERVFERFYRQLGTNTSGSGLGLSIVQQITELHHGRMSLCQSPDLHGACFVIILPTSEDLTPAGRPKSGVSEAAFDASVADQPTAIQTKHKSQNHQTAPLVD